MLGKYVTRKQSMFRLQLVLNGYSDLINCNSNLLINRHARRRGQVSCICSILFTLNKKKCVLNRTMEKNRENYYM